MHAEMRGVMIAFFALGALFAIAAIITGDAGFIPKNPREASPAVVRILGVFFLAVCLYALWVFTEEDRKKRS